MTALVIPNAVRNLRMPLTGSRVAEIPRLWLGMTAMALIVLAACAPAPPPIQEPGSAPAEVGLSPGQRAPDFQVTTLDGQPLTNAQASGGKPYVLYFFATW